MKIYYNLKNSSFRLPIKIIAVFLAIIITISIIPSFAYANDGTNEISENVQEDEKYAVSEIEDLRDEYTKTYLMSDHTMQVVQYSQPVHYQDGDEWYEYDLSLCSEKKQTSDDFDGYKSDAPDFNVKFADSINSDTLVSINKDKYSLKWTLNDVAKMRSLISDVEIASKEETADEPDKLTVENAKDSITYSNFRKNSDLNYQVNPEGIKENIILNSKSDSYEYSYIIEAVDLVMELDKAGNILCSDSESREKVFYIPHAYMYDAVYEVSTDVNYSLNQREGNIYELVISANEDWINDENRQFPVTIDPQVEINSENKEMTICNISSTKSLENLINDDLFLIGWPNSTYGNCSAMLKFDVPEIDENSTILSAQLVLQEKGVINRPLSFSTILQINAYKINTAWTKISNSWLRPIFDLRVLDYSKVSESDKDILKKGHTVPKVFDITSAVNDWYEGDENWGIFLESKNTALETLCASFFYNSINDSKTQPMLIINYRTNSGIEPYWTYTEMNNGESDTAYVNNYNGNLIYSHTDASTTGNKMPIEIKHIYNRCNLRNFHRIGPDVGENWKLNIQQTVRYASFYGLDNETAKQFPYIYEDGDGTPHYFYKKVNGSKVEYLDEDGLGLEFKIINDSNGKYYIITDKNDNVMTFNDLGNLIKYEDCQKTPKSMNITYKRVVKDNIPYDIITQVADGSGHIITFNYDSKDDVILRSIEDEKGVVTTYSYNNGLLIQISSTSGVNYTYDYTLRSKSLKTAVNENDNSYINIDYNIKLFGERIKSIYEYSEKDENKMMGQNISFNWFKNITNVIYCNTSDTNDSDYVCNAYRFDSAGRTLSVKSFSQGKNYGAAIYDYTSSSNSMSVDDIKKRNKITCSASLNKNTYNLINNIGAEFDGGWQNSSVNGSEYRVAYDTASKYEGNRAFKINCLSSVNDGRARFCQDFTTADFVPGETYTFSSYVKTSNLKQVSAAYQYSGAGLIVTAYDENNKGITNFQSEYILGTTDYGENGWTRLYTTFIVPENAALLRVNLIVRNATGIASFDNVQFEKSDTPSSVNLIENSNFKRIYNSNPNADTNYNYDLPERWSASNLANTITSKVITSEENTEFNTFRIYGDTSANRMLMTDVYVSPNESDTYIVSGWAKGNAVPGNVTNEDSDFNISIKINYSDGSYVYKHDIAFNKYESDWQYMAGAFSLDDGTSAKKTPTYVTVFLRFKKQANSVEFKNIQLIKADANSYVYDSDGNAINASNSAAQSLSNTYNGSDLTKTVDKNGYVTEFKYDDYHNVINSTSQNGIETNYKYNDSGQITSSETMCSDKFLLLRNETEYTQADEEKGISAGAYVSKTIDENGHAVNYDYDLQSGNLNSVTNQNGVSTEYAYDSITNRLISTSSLGTTESYSYNNNSLSSLSRTGADGKSLDYSMTYSNFGYLTSTKVGNQFLSSNTYNEKNGHMLQTIYGNGDKLNYTYDNIGNVTSVKQNDELTNSSVYNNRGLLMTDKDHINGLSTDYGYDIINRVTGKKVHTFDSMQSIFATEYKYDINSQITRIVNTAGGRRYSQNYEYGKDGLLTKYTFSADKTIEYSYDGLSRLDKKVFKTGADNDLITKYLYKDSDRKQSVMNCYTTHFIKSEIINNHNYSYDYDALGNIIRISEKTRVDIGNPKEVVSYEYDDLSQLTRENNKNLNQTITYEYDSGGNILNKKIYPLTTGEITGSPTKTITYSYENSNWCDQLTAYNGQQITYDEIGNPINYLGYNMSWFGRQLNSLSGNGLDVSYAYDQSGTRISKTVNGVKYEYQYEGGKLFYEKRDKAEFYYLYDGLGHLTSIIHYDGNGNRAQYYVLCNSRGDVVDIYNQDGTIAAHYIYDSWGNTVSILDNDVNGNEITDPNNIGIINQIRYRGYYLDTETGYYYLMSRYYNPEIGRFLNADIFCSTGDSAFATNMYVYCLNNPVNSIDLNGLKTATETVGIVITEIFVCWDVQWVAIITQQDFSFNGFEDYKEKKAEIYKNGFDSGLVNFWSGATNVATTITEWLCGFAGYAEPLLPNSVKSALKALPYVIDVINDYSGRYLSPMGALIMVLSDVVINGMIDIFGSFVSIMINGFVGNTFSWIAGHLYGENQRNQFELLAYNWYLY